MRYFGLFVLMSIVLAACGRVTSADVGPIPEVTPLPTETEGSDLEPVDMDAPRNNRVNDDTSYRIRSNLPLDAIPPIYDPEFVPAEQAPLEADELILGVAWQGKAKAYPISVLRIREMVNDELAGIPTLVTW